MRPWRSWLHPIIALGLVAGLGCRRGPGAPPLATLIEAVGSVERGHGGSYLPVPVGIAFSLGDAVRTGDASRARVKFATGSVLRLGERALVRLLAGQKGNEAALSAEFGEAEIEVERDGAGFFYLSTTLGFARLEPGTRVRLRASTQATRYDVLVGRATLLDATDQTAWGAGEGLEIAIGGARVERYKVDVGAAERLAGPDAGAAAAPDARRAEAAPPAAQTVILEPNQIRASIEHPAPPVDVTVPAGETAVIHEPHGPVAVRITFEQVCAATGGIVETAGPTGSFRRPAQRSTGKTNAVVVLKPGRHRYRVACGDGHGATAGGTLMLKSDAGTAAIPRTPPRNTIDADGRKYTVLYQNRLPTLTFVWPRAAGTTDCVLHLETDGKERVFATPGPRHTLPSGAIAEGSHRWWFSTPDGKTTSAQTPLVVRFDNAAATAQLQSPAEGAFPAEASIEVAGIALEGSTATINGKPLAIDAHGRFHGQADRPGTGDRAIAVRLESPRSGIHYYVRRTATANK